MVSVRPIEFQSCGVCLKGRFHLPDELDQSQKQPIVMMATGDGINGSKSSTWPPLINAMTEIPVPVFIFDFYGLGDSDGEVGRFSTTVAISNLEDAIAVVKQEPWVDTTRIGILGSSFGAAVSLITQARHRVFKVLGLKSPVSFLPESYESEVGDNLTTWKNKGTIDEIKFHYNAYLDCIKYNIYDLINGLDTPTLIVHGEADTIVPIKQSRRLACLMANSNLRSLPGVNHGYKEENALAELIRHCQEFFRMNL